MVGEQRVDILLPIWSRDTKSFCAGFNTAEGRIVYGEAKVTLARMWRTRGYPGFHGPRLALSTNIWQAPLVWVIPLLGFYQTFTSDQRPSMSSLDLMSIVVPRNRAPLPRH
jgi:hypothetical protein